MKSLVVSIVDVLGIFIPGSLLFVGIMLLPIALGYTDAYKAAWQATPEATRTNVAGLGVIVVIISYATGFVIRLCAINLLQRITKPWWVRTLSKKSEALNPVFEACLDYPELCTALKDVYVTASMGHITGYAPYFSFAKRIIRNGNTPLWSDAERLEAETRFSAGLFIPFCVLAINGLLLIRHQPFGWILTVTSLFGCLVILLTFPRRRIREVLHIYTMAIVTLRYKPANPSSKAEGKDVGEAG
jgi:hypothetical protein